MPQWDLPLLVCAHHARSVALSWPAARSHADYGRSLCMPCSAPSDPCALRPLPTLVAPRYIFTSRFTVVPLISLPSSGGWGCFLSACWQSVQPDWRWKQLISAYWADQHLHASQSSLTMPHANIEWLSLAGRIMCLSPGAAGMCQPPWSTSSSAFRPAIACPAARPTASSASPAARPAFIPTRRATASARLPHQTSRLMAHTP